MSSPAYQVFMSDPGRREVVLCNLKPYELAGAAEVNLYASTDKTPPGVTQRHEAQLLTPVAFQVETFLPGTVGELPKRAGGEIRIGGHFGNLDSYADPTLYAWDGRAAVLRFGGYSPKLGRWLNYDEYEPRYYLIEAARLEGEELVVSTRDQSSQLGDELQTRTFLDTGWMLKGGGTASDFVSFGDIAKLRIADELTFQARVFYKSTGAYQHLFGWPGQAYRVGIDSTGHLEVDWHKATVNTVKTMAAAMTDGSPYVLEGILTDTQLVLKIIPESTRVAVREVFTGTGWTGRDAAGGVAAFRYFLSFGASNPSASMLDLVRIWAAAKTETYLINRRYRGLTTAEKAEAALAQDCELDDGTGSTVTDASSSPANGTINGTCPWYPSLLGAPEAVGNVLPDCFGAVEGEEAVLVSAAFQIYMTHSRSMDSIDNTYEGAIPHDRDTDYTDVFTFLADVAAATAAAPAEFSTLIADWGSYFVLGSQPQRKVTFDGDGDDTGSGYAETVADIARRMLTTRGSVQIADPGGLDTATFTALNTAAPAIVGYFFRDRITRGEALAKILGSVGATTYTVRSTGLQAVYQFNGVPAGDPVLVLTEADIEESSIKELQPAHVSNRQLIGHRRCGSPMQTGEIAPGATAEMTAFYAKDLRWAPSDGDNRTVHRLAEEVKTETCLRVWNDALEEANRRQALFGSPVKPLEFRANLKGIALDRFQKIQIRIRDLDVRGRWQSRWNLGDGAERIVLGVAETVQSVEDGIEGTATLVVWG